MLVVGERPGEDEARRGRPFVGRAGQAQRAHFSLHGLDVDKFRLDNVCPDYHPGNTTPTPADVERWGPRLLSEVRRVQPKIIVAAGAISTRFFLGDSAFMEAVHGVPHAWSDGNGVSATVVPVYHPAAPFHQPDLLQFVVYDYGRASAAIRGRLDLEPPIDQHPRPKYYDIDDGVTDWYLGQTEDAIGYDTEGTPGHEWSAQFCTAPGSGLVLRKDHPRFERDMKEVRRLLRKRKPVVVIHNSIYDVEMGQGLGFDLLDLDARIFDTMMAAYLICVEPQSLKMLARRHCGMEMSEYIEVVGKAGEEKQLAYLEAVMSREWPAPEPRIKRGHDGTARVYKPQPVNRRAEAILIDYYSGKVDKDGDTIDPHKRWRKVDRELRRMVERTMGKFPIGTLADIPLGEAVHYSGRDPDACLRVYRKLAPALDANDLASLMQLKMDMLPAAAQMKINGLLGERTAFEQLRDDMWDEMDVIQGRISRKYFGGRPFNPASPPQTETLMRRRGLVGEKRTPKGRMSTSKKSIEHLRFEDPAIEDLEQWRERQKIKDSFAESVLEEWPEGEDRARVKVDLKITRVSSGRFSGAILDDVPSAPLLAIPVRSKLGKRVRDCYVAEEGYVLGSWDLDQAEMRLMADESGDPTLVRLFNEGKLDIHTDTASKMFGVQYSAVDKMKHRYPAKRVGFGVITGIQGPGLLDQLRMAGVLNYNLDDCETFIREWLKIYPGVKDYMQWCRDECRRKGGVIRDRWGMPRYLPAILNETREGKWDRLEAERQTHSHRIQGGAQGMLQVAMAAQRKRLRPYGDLVRPILQIHDELIYEVADDPEIREEVSSIIVDTMCNTTKLKVPIKSSGSYGKRWGELKD